MEYARQGLSVSVDRIIICMMANADPACDEMFAENPAITTQCNHQFHLACIYEWLERSQTCPVCDSLIAEMLALVLRQISALH